MTQKEKDQLAVVNLLMQLQQVVYACDAVEHISWFNAHRTKNAVNGLVRIILTDHKEAINAFWKTEGVDMANVSRVIDEFQSEVAQVKYHKLPQLTQYIIENPELKEL